MVKMCMENGVADVEVEGTNFDLMVESSVLMTELTKALLKNCSLNIKEGVVETFKESINFAITLGSK